MSYDAKRQENARRRLTFLEIDLSFCQLTYGVAPCTAALGAGEIKCFNTRNITNDCQDPANFSPALKTYRFIEDQAELPPELDGFPCLMGWDTSPTEVQPDGGPGIRSAFSAQLFDFRHHDRGLDKYARERAYDPAQRGTFFGKFRARNPFYWGAPARIVTGYLNSDGSYDPANFETRHYIVTDFSGPDTSGTVKVQGRDPIKKTDDNRAKFPKPSTGKLSADITAGETTATLVPAGVGDAEYPASGKVSMGEEIASFTRSGDTLTLTRGVSNTTAEEQDAGTTVQVVGTYTSQPAQDIVYDLWVNYANFPAKYIDKAAWDAEANDWFNYVYTAEIPKPTGVSQLTKELGKQAGFLIYWDDRQPTAVMKALRPTPPDTPVLDDASHLYADSVQVQDVEDKRITQSWVYHGQVNPIEDLTEPRNYQSLQIETVAEDLYDAPKVDIVFSRWIPRDGVAAARSVAQRRLDRFSNVPRAVSFRLDAKDAGVWVGDVRRLKHRNLQTASGEPEQVPVQVLKVKDDGQDVYQYRTLEYRVLPRDSDIPKIIIDTDKTNFNVRDAYETTIGALGTEAVEVRVIIDANATVTGMVGGGMPEGTVVYLDITDGATLEGVPGPGGDGGNASAFWDAEGEYWLTSASPGFDGGDGGHALEVTEEWVIRRFGTAYFVAGSGGGGGGGGIAYPGETAPGGGGGGSQALTTNPGGAAGTANNSDGATEYPGDPGQAGDINGPGAGGTGGGTGKDFPFKDNDGGDGAGWGLAGQPGQDGLEYDGANPQSPPEDRPGGAGGAAGLLVKTNGYRVTIIEGNDPTYVKGDIEP